MAARRLEAGTHDGPRVESFRSVGVCALIPYDAVVIGGGFFGCRLALHLNEFAPKVALVEESDRLLGRASYNNQARVHQGYHYPHSLLTAFRSRINFARFSEEYSDCVVASFEKYYAISRVFSSVTAAQFKTFCDRIGAPIEPSRVEIRNLFDRALIEDVFLVEESAFDASALRTRITRDLDASDVETCHRTRALGLSSANHDLIAVDTVGPEGERRLMARAVFNCTYASLNRLLVSSDLPMIPLKHEGTEIALVEPPDLLADKGVTVMCGPFFSIMPFPALGVHSLSHVRYTPHVSWMDDPHAAQAPPWSGEQATTAFARMVRDARRYMPCLEECRSRGSLWEIKTVLPASEVDDSRPILFRRDHGLRNLYCILGGKIDNVYDVLHEIDGLRSSGEFR